jgi:hypothetical protein
MTFDPITCPFPKIMIHWNFLYIYKYIYIYIYIYIYDAWNLALISQYMLF